jgi:DNA-directed RNA polymerase subunit RPC12/RpoP
MSEIEPTSDEDEADPPPQCKCGTDRLSKYSVVDREYSFVRTLYLLWGGTSVPTKVSFRCVKCGDMFESSTRPAVCREHIK